MAGMRAIVRATGAAAVAVAVAAVWLPILDRARVFSGMDFANLLWPQARLVSDAYRQGVFPFWNPWSWGGCPLLAAMQSAPLYPPMWLALLVGLPWGLHAFIFGHLIFAGIGCARLARRALGVRDAGLILAATAYAGAGFFLGHIEQANSVAAMAWAPWITDAVFAVVMGVGSPVWLAVCLALASLAGHPHHVALAVLFAGVLSVVAAMMDRRHKWMERLPALLVGIGGAAALAVLLTCPQILPARELAALGERVRPYADPCDPALEWRFLPGLAIPRFFNTLTGTVGPPIQYTELGLYAGILTLPLFLFGAFSGFRRRQPGVIAATVTFACALAYALGRQGGLAPLLQHLVPFLGQSRGAARALNSALIFYAVVSGAGLWRLQALVRFSTPRRRILRPLPYLIALAVVADLAVTHAPELAARLIPQEAFQLPNPTLKAIASAFPETPNPQFPVSRLYRFMANDSDYFLDYRASAVRQRLLRLQPNMNAPDGVATIDGYEEGLLPTRAYANFLRRFNRNLRFETLDARLLALMGGAMVLTEYPDDRVGPDWERVALLPNPSGAPLRLLRNRIATSLFLNAVPLRPPDQDRSDPATGPFSFREDRGPHFDSPGRERVAHPLDTVTSDAFRQAVESAAVRVEATTPNRLTLSLDPSPSRKLWLLQAPFPGWKLRAIDRSGRSVANIQLVAETPVNSSFVWPPPPSDATRATLAFEPFSFRLGLFGFFLGLCIAMACGVRRILT